MKIGSAKHTAKAEMPKIVRSSYCHSPGNPVLNIRSGIQAGRSVQCPGTITHIEVTASQADRCPGGPLHDQVSLRAGMERPVVEIVLRRNIGGGRIERDRLLESPQAIVTR